MRRSSVFLFDKDYSSYILAHACGAEYYDILGEGDRPLSFYPLAMLDTLADRVWAQEWLEILLMLQGVHATPGQRKALCRALELLAASPSRTLTDLVNTLQDHQLRDGLNHYTLAGGLGGLLDAADDSLGLGAFQVFEIGHLMNLGEKNLVPILLYLFRRVERRLREERPSLLIIEEAWITALNTTFGQKAEEWLRTLRKKNTAGRPRQPEPCRRRRLEPARHHPGVVSHEDLPAESRSR